MDYGLVEDFKKELSKLIRIKNPKHETLTGDTCLDDLDSLSRTEVCMYAEELLGVTIEFVEIQHVHKYEDLVALLEKKGVEVSA